MTDSELTFATFVIVAVFLVLGWVALLIQEEELLP